jgi:hypothetical protein
VEMRDAKALGETSSLFTKSFARAEIACVGRKRVKGRAQFIAV